ncbi:MAG TPA: phospholipase D-like domain-containing protein [Nevskia sp.]|nr:phospholipase D-like domain-containing protein [Nevskia sp.]
MSEQKLSAFEQSVIAGLADRPSLAAAILDAWGDLPAESPQTAGSLVQAAQLGVTEEVAAQEFLERATNLSLLEPAPSGFRPRLGVYARFRRLALAFNAIELYRTSIHQDATRAQVVLTKPLRPSVLERNLSALGWRTTDLEPTDRAFHSLVQAARQRVVVLTPFFDAAGAVWLTTLLSNVATGVECILVLRSLEDPSRQDYPDGLSTISAWLNAHAIKVYNYSIARPEGGRETFHAKVVLCDRSAAYVGSSNLTTASLEYSMEMGVVLQGRSAADVSEAIDAVLATATPWNLVP